MNRLYRTPEVALALSRQSREALGKRKPGRSYRELDAVVIRLRREVQKRIGGIGDLPTIFENGRPRVAMTTSQVNQIFTQAEIEVLERTPMGRSLSEDFGLDLGRLSSAWIRLRGFHDMLDR